MEQGSTCCPVCTLYLREGITLQAHLETHPKDKVIEALLRVTNGKQTGQAAPSQSPSASEGFMQAQPYITPNTGFMSQTQNYANPQTQVTAAVTYQQFVTNNGSAVIPQYIQVPTMVGPNSNTPMIPSQSLTYVPNQPNTYAHTMYNPLYNPYIPQPYPMVQPVYTHMPITSDSNTQASSSQISNSVSSASNSQSAITAKPDTVLKQVSSVATNTGPNKDGTIKIKAKKLPIRSTTQTKLRITKQLGSRLKTTTSALATVATKSYRITSISGKTNSTAKTSVITKARSFRTKNRPLLPKPSPSAASSVTRAVGSRSGSLSGTPPPISKAPRASASFELPAVVKTEKTTTESEDSNSKPETPGKITDKVREYLLDQETAPVNSEIVESSSAIQITSDLLIGSPEACENEAVSNFESEPVLPCVSSVKNGTFEQSEACESNVYENFEVEKDPFESEQDHGSDYDEELPDKLFYSLEIEEEKKVAFSFLENREISEEVNSDNADKNSDDIFGPEESVQSRDESEENARKRTENSEFPENSTPPPQNVPNSKRVSCVIPVGNGNTSVETPSTERTAQIGEIRNFADLKSVTYTDLQPAANSKVLQDLGITTSFNLNNYMEVDGIKIYFNNANVQNIPLEPIIKFTSSLKTDVTKVQNYMKSESESENLVESVIHLVSGTTQKSDFSDETFHNSNSDGHADFRDLSPLTLNIRADESMPARGELSEQESLGAENSNWGLFRSEISKNQEELRTATYPPIVHVQNVGGSIKTFKCSLCREVFSCLRDRRVHRSTVHEKSRSVPRKQKCFTCTQCKEKFTSLKDRRRHVIQSHFFDPRRERIKLEGETRDENAVRDVGVDLTEPAMTIKLEQDETTVKTETPADGQSNKSSCEVTKNCPCCNLPFTGTKKLKEHLKEVHGLSRHKCETCSETFDNETDYNTHLRIHPLECSQCGKMFSRKPNLKLHLKRHLLVKPYMCKQCPKSFITRQKLDEHLNGHSGNKPLKCSLCDSTFSRHSNLIQHKNIHHLYGKKKVKDFVCRCGEVFHSMRKLEWHKEVHDAKPKTCPFCSQKFIHINSVTRHIRRSHIPHYLPNDKKDIENVQCPVCGKIYLRSSLLVHMRVHNGEKPFVCKICNKGFTTKWNLELHNWTHQSRNNMPYKCNICKSAFFREVDYVAHLNSHRNYRPFTCNVCGQKFIRKYNCLRHQGEHKKEKKFICTVSGCGKSFHRSYYLRDHLRVHTGVRPHTCHICGKASTTKSNHNKHVRIHDTREPLNTEN